MGSVIGGHLAAAGNHVVLINIDADYVAAVNANGLVLESDAIERVVDVQAATSSDNAQ